MVEEMRRVFTRFLLMAVASFVVCAAPAIEEQVLYFQIDDANLHFSPSGEDCSYSFAMVALTTDGETPTGDYLNLYGGGYGGGASEPLGQALASGSAAAYAGLGSGVSDTSRLLFELWLEEPAGSFQKVGYHTVLVSELAGHIFSGGAMAVVTPYLVSTVVPEPTSGILVLLGAAVLSLRRRRLSRGGRDVVARPLQSVA